MSSLGSATLLAPSQGSTYMSGWESTRPPIRMKS
jgi:hypothetical protein